MRIQETTVYQFDELDERGKERARDWYRQGHEFDAEPTIDDFERICELIGVELETRAVPLHGGGTRHKPNIYYSGFSSQGDGASFTGTYRYKKGALKAVREYAPQDEELHRIATDLQTVQQGYFYGLVAHITLTSHHNYSHEHTVTIYTECYDRHDREHTVSRENQDHMTDLMRGLMRWLYRQLETQYEYELGDEQVDDAIRVNEYEFTEDGRRS